jgi:hypothetical protein
MFLYTRGKKLRCILTAVNTYSNSIYITFFFLVSCSGERLSSLGTSATNWPFVPIPYDRLLMWRSRLNENWQGKPKFSEKTCPSATLSTKIPHDLTLARTRPPRWEAVD